MADPPGACALQRHGDDIESVATTTGRPVPLRVISRVHPPRPDQVTLLSPRHPILWVILNIERSGCFHLDEHHTARLLDYQVNLAARGAIAALENAIALGL